MVEKVIAKKALGQNFLSDLSIARLMVENVEIKPNDYVIEIGAGTGAVTQHLAQVCNLQKAFLTAVEFDIDLIPILKSKIIENENVKIVNANILNLLDKFEVPQNSPLKIIGSLPYNITSPLIHRLIQNDPMPKTCVFLIQKEVAQKITCTAPDSNYLSTFVQTFYTTEILKVVDKKVFSPVPKVDGAVIKLVKKPIDTDFTNVPRYERFLHHAFSNPRKMLNKTFTKEQLEKYGFDKTKRPQNYNNEDYLKAFLSK